MDEKISDLLREMDQGLEGVEWTLRRDRKYSISMEWACEELQHARKHIARAMGHTVCGRLDTKEPGE